MKIFKQKYLLLLLLAGVLISPGCGEDYLSKSKVHTSLDTDAFYQTEMHAEQAVTAMYSPLHWWGQFKRFRYLLGFMSGDLEITSGGFHFTEFGDFGYNASTASYIRHAWQSSFVGIQRANTVLEKVPGIYFYPENKEVQERYLAEAHFMRAFYNFQLVRFYGGVPIYDRTFTGSLEDELFQPKRNTVDEVYEFIYADLEKAMEILPVSYEGKDIGRPTKGAAAGYLAKAYMFQGEYSKAHAILKDMVGGKYGQYELMEDFSDNFTRYNENNAESVFEIQFMSGFGSPWPDMDAPNASKALWLATAIDPGQFANGLPSPELNDFFDAHPNESGVRRMYTIARPGDVWGDWNPIAKDPVAAGQWTNRTEEGSWSGGVCGVRKYAEGTDVEGFVQSGINFRALRYADILLLYAEAENELNGPTQIAIDAINQLRTRAQADLLDGTFTQEEFFEKIVIERRLELSLEYHRFFDLTRWSKHKTNLPAMADINKVLESTNYRPGKELFPIPLNDILRNPNLKQNPGY